jgi:hypothetical protein
MITDNLSDELLVWDIIFQTVDKDTAYFQGVTEAGTAALRSWSGAGTWMKGMLVIINDDDAAYYLDKHIDSFPLSVLTLG